MTGGPKYQAAPQRRGRRRAPGPKPVVDLPGHRPVRPAAAGIHDQRALADPSPGRRAAPRRRRRPLRQSAESLTARKRAAGGAGVTAGPAQRGATPVHGPVAGARVSAEEGAHVLRGSPVLGRHRTGVMAGHVHRRPTQACLLLRLADHPIQLGRLEVSERMQVDVGGNARPVPQGREGVAEGVGIRRTWPPGS